MRAAEQVAGWIARDLAGLHDPRYGTAGQIRVICIEDLAVIVDDIVVSARERRLLAGGQVARVCADRVVLANITAPLVATIVRQATRRRVVAFSAQVNLDARVEIAVLRLEPVRVAARRAAPRTGVAR